MKSNKYFAQPEPTVDSVSKNFNSTLNTERGGEVVKWCKKFELLDLIDDYSDSGND